MVREESGRRVQIQVQRWEAESQSGRQKSICLESKIKYERKMTGR